MVSTEKIAGSDRLNVILVSYIEGEQIKKHGYYLVEMEKLDDFNQEVISKKQVPPFAKLIEELEGTASKEVINRISEFFTVKFNT